jgi:3-oxoacyl-[acyl-carrier protein] reductase
MTSPTQTTIGSYADLRGQAALVTGASSGIGFGIAEALLAQGCRVAVHYRGQRGAAEALCARFPGQAVAVGADLGTEEGCVAVARAARAALPDLSLLVHSAGIWNDGPIASISRATLEGLFRVNTFSAFYLVRELLPALRQGGVARPGRVVFIGSTAGQRGEAFHGHYAASKGALQALAQSLTVELGPEVRVNTVSPGWVRTPMAEEALQRIGPTLLPTLPNRRVAEVDDVVAATLFLASSASGHLLGQDLGVSGGALAVLPRGQLKKVE